MRKTTIGLVVLLLGAGAAFADHHAKADAAGAPDEAAMLEAFIKAGAPGEHHAHLAKMIGDWTATAEMWPVPGAPVQTTQARAKVASLFGGRFVEMSYEGDFAGTPFTGTGLDAYDNITGKHRATWIDSMSTSIMFAEGTCSDGGDVTTTWAEVSDPMSGGLTKVKNVITMVDADTFVYESWALGVGPDGSDHKAMRITFKRAS